MKGGQVSLIISTSLTSLQPVKVVIVCNKKYLEIGGMFALL